MKSLRARRSPIGPTNAVLSTGVYNTPLTRQSFLEWPFRSLVCSVLPLNSPLHRLISNQHRDRPVNDLMTGTAEGGEDLSATDTSKRVLSVLREAVVDDAFLGHGA